MNQILCDKLIQYYEKAILEIENLEQYDAFKKLTKLYLTLGICACAEHVFNENIYNDSWVESFNPNSPFWFHVIGSTTEVTDMIDSLQLRINRLKTFKEIQ